LSWGRQSTSGAYIICESDNGDLAGETLDESLDLRGIEDMNLFDLLIGMDVCACLCTGGMYSDPTDFDLEDMDDDVLERYE